MADMSWLLSHHPPSEHSRCVHFRGLRICRRCLVLYPATFLICILQFTDWRFPPSLLPRLPLLAFPAAADFVLERLDLISYRPWRVMAGSLLLAVALGAGFAQYLENPFSFSFWAMVIGFGLPTSAAAFFRTWVDLRMRF